MDSNQGHVLPILESLIPGYAIAMRQALVNGDIEDLGRMLDLLIAINPEQLRREEQESAPQERAASMDVMPEGEEDGHSEHENDGVCEYPHGQGEIGGGFSVFTDGHPNQPADIEQNANLQVIEDRGMHESRKGCST